MQAVVRDNRDTPLTTAEIAERLERGISLAYRGDIANPRNLTRDVPEHQNTCLFISGLPPQITLQDVLGTLAAEGPFGSIFATSLLAASEELGHATAAAKVQFFTRAGAQLLFDRARQRQRPLCMGGRPVEVVWNRHRTPEQQKPGSRVLGISGRMDVVNEEFLTEFFQTKFVFQTEAVIVRSENHATNQRVLEWRFGSFRAQADAARKTLRLDFRGISTWFCSDPVGPGRGEVEGDGHEPEEE